MLLLIRIHKQVENMKVLRQKKRDIVKNGFTMIELFVVMAILAITALLAVPMISSATDVQVSSAAQMIAADLAYAKSLAINSQKNYTVSFDLQNDSYQILDSIGNIIENPRKSGSLFQIDLRSEHGVEKVDITAVDFDSQTAVTFDYLGSPYSGTTTASHLDAGQISLNARNFNMDIEIAPVTGNITIP